MDLASNDQPFLIMSRFSTSYGRKVPGWCNCLRRYKRCNFFGGFHLEPVPKDVARPSFFVKITSGGHNDKISTRIEGANNHD